MATELLKLTIGLVTSHMSNNKMEMDAVPGFIQKVHDTLSSIERLEESGMPSLIDQRPATTMRAETRILAAPQVIEQPEPVRAKLGRPKKVTTSIQAVLPMEPAPIIEAAKAPAAPAVDFRTMPLQEGEDPNHRGVFDDKIICLEDGKKVTLLTAYIRNRFEMTPEQYRAKWGLADDYPMTPPGYVAAKRAMAKETGLGITLRSKKEKRRTTSPAVAAAAVAENPAMRSKRKAGTLKLQLGSH